MYLAEAGMAAVYLTEPQMKGKLEACAMKRVATGAHLPTPWPFEPAKRPEDRTDYCLDCFQTQCKHQVIIFTFEWTGAHPMGGEW